MKTYKDIFITLLITAVVFLAGLLVGKYCCNTIPEKETEVVYVKGDTIYQTIEREKLVPYEVVERDTILLPADTTALFAVWEDYYRTRKYELDFSSDSTGVFKVDASVSQNSLVDVKSTIQPIIKTVIEKETVPADVKFLQYYFSVGTSVHNFSTQQITLGLEFVNKYNIGISGIRYMNDLTYTVNLGVKF